MRRFAFFSSHRSGARRESGDQSGTVVASDQPTEGGHSLSTRDVVPSPDAADRRVFLCHSVPPALSIGNLGPHRNEILTVQRRRSRGRRWRRRQGHRTRCLLCVSAIFSAERCRQFSRRLEGEECEVGFRSVATAIPSVSSFLSFRFTCRLRFVKRFPPGMPLP